MRDDPPAAAFRLACALPSRTHEWRPPAPKKDTRHTRSHHAQPGRGRGGLNRKRIIIAGVSYASIHAAAKAHGRSNSYIHALLDSGRARYA